MGLNCDELTQGETMTIETAAPTIEREPELLGQTVVVIGGSAGIGLETARHARAAGANVILTGRDPERLKHAASDVEALSTATFDATDPALLERFFQDLATPIDHVMVTAGAPRYGPPLEMAPEEARRGLTEHLMLALGVARGAAGKVKPPGSLVFMGGTGARRPRAGLAIASTATVASPTLIANLALELAPIRVNLIAAGFVDTPLSASILGDDLDKRRDELRATLPIGRVVGPADVAALAVHLMSNTALTGATYDIDGGQQLVSG
jgi:NAD(P)-dependent dehydrogenase (short-subunit alcohol dehydrogenase family)